MLVCTMIVIFSPEGRLSGINEYKMRPHDIMMNERCAKDLDLPNSEYDFVLFTPEVELYSMYDDARLVKQCIYKDIFYKL